MIDNKTPNFNLALPDPSNKLSEDVIRIVSAITQIDLLIKTLGSSYSLYASQSNFPATGTGGVTYIAQDVKSIFIWTGSAYTEISPFPSSTDSVSEGTANLYFTAARARAAMNYALNVLQRGGSSASVSIQSGLLPVKNRAGATVNISITQ